MQFDVTALSFQNLDAWAWLQHILALSSPVACATLWWVWRARNSVCLENQVVGQTLVVSITSMASDISCAFPTAGSMRVGQARLVSWCPYSRDGAVLNVDGNVLETPPHGGFGGCNRGPTVSG